LDREKISVTIITHNEEENIRDCIESVKWADEILIVDSGSTDRTIEISKGYTDKVFFNAWKGMKEQKQYAVEKASHNWIFSIDADERATEAIKQFILEELRKPAYDGYRFPRQNYFLGRWLKHGGWYPDHVLRLFRRDRGYFGGINPHDKVVVGTGRVATVKIPFVHHTYKSIAQYMTKQNMYSGISAQELFSSGKRVNPNIIPLKTLWKFIETYFVKKGFLDGYRGFIVAMGATYSMFWKYIQLWELSRKDK
jgi:glycosyltransferase involved in cell wall biosynthesis